MLHRTQRGVFLLKLKSGDRKAGSPGIDCANLILVEEFSHDPPAAPHPRLQFSFHHRGHQVITVRSGPLSCCHWAYVFNPDSNVTGEHKKLNFHCWRSHDRDVVQGSVAPQEFGHTRWGPSWFWPLGLLPPFCANVRREEGSLWGLVGWGQLCVGGTSSGEGWGSDGGGEQKELLLFGCSGKYGCVKFVRARKKKRVDRGQNDPSEQKRRGSDQTWSLKTAVSTLLLWIQEAREEGQRRGVEKGLPVQEEKDLNLTRRGTHRVQPDRWEEGEKLGWVAGNQKKGSRLTFKLCSKRANQGGEGVNLK